MCDRRRWRTFSRTGLAPLMTSFVLQLRVEHHVHSSPPRRRRNCWSCAPTRAAHSQRGAAVGSRRGSEIHFRKSGPHQEGASSRSCPGASPGNLLVGPLGIVDWEGWGRAPEHFDLAMLYVHTLVAPDSRRSLVNTLGGQLYSDAALPALAFVAAKVLARSVSGDYLTLVDPVHHLLDNLTARSLGAGGTTMRLR